jgi:hypothetical protein
MNKLSNLDFDNYLNEFNMIHNSNLIRLEEYKDIHTKLAILNKDYNYKFNLSLKELKNALKNNSELCKAKPCHHKNCSYSKCIHQEAWDNFSLIKNIYITSNNSQQEIADLLHISKEQAHHIMTELDLFNLYGKDRKQNKYYKTYCYNPFYELDRPEINWLLGYIMSDGNINIRNDRQIKTLNITSVDLELIEYCCDLFKLDKKQIKPTYNKTLCYRLDIPDNNICDRLLELGIKPRKSYIETTEIKFNPYYKFDFLRGLFDGDGCASNGNFSVVGHPSYIKWLHDNFFNFTRFYYKTGSKLASMEVSSIPKLVFLYNKMYYNDTVPCLSRKRTKLKSKIKGLKLDKVSDLIYTDEIIPVCDITVQGVHTFNVNDIWTKNCDFNAEEIRVPALWSREPAWVNAFSSGSDVHKSCYSLDTEFLTPNGFKTYDQIDFDDLIGQYDEDLQKVTWVKAGHKFYNETNEMYHFKGNNTDLLVTPNHRMYTKGKKNWYIKRADEVINNKYLTTICSPDIVGKDDYPDYYIIPKSSKKSELKIPMKDFVELIGYLLTDGGTCLKSQGQKVIYLSQSEAKPKVLNKILELNKRLGNIFTDSIDNNLEYSSFILDKEIKKSAPFHRLSIANSSFFDKIVLDFGGPLKPKRKLPTWFKNLPKDLLQIFLDAYIDGDGTTDKRKNRFCSTIYIANKQMVDDLQYICLRLGYSTNISSKIESTGSTMYKLNITKNKREVKVSNEYTEVLHYDAPVKSVCFSVPTGLLIVRRNGKVSVCGNTAVAIWGEENYSKDKRKLAKRC